MALDKHSIAHIFYLFAVILGINAQCNIPPRFWCNDRAIAKQCGVLRQCETWQWSDTKDASRVNFTLYYESLCPDCQGFMNRQLGPTYQKLHSIMNLTLVPYGNAKEMKANEEWKFTCQHGPLECQGNIIETCAINLVKNISVYFPFIFCMEKSDREPAPAAQECAKQHSVPIDDIMKCSMSKAGNEMEHEMAVKTDALRPRHTWVPWVTLNGVHTDEIQQEAEHDLTKLICDTYKGHPKPDVCS